ncbi:hypothetical protein ACQPZF_20745 [Actinosynnema sp. CS-041913]|uniref:hypothetical protein n=1 Tax=Actinosynnema sp. CS-041913 TaxID=3239917 RepID=UPI003D8F3E51
MDVNLSPSGHAGPAGRQRRQRLIGLLCKTLFPLLLVAIFMAVPLTAGIHFPQWWDRWWAYVVPAGTVLLGMALWLRHQGERIAWRGEWDFARPPTTPRAGTAGDGDVSAAPGDRRLFVPRRPGLRLLGYLMWVVAWLCCLAGMASTLGGMTLAMEARAHPWWVMGVATGLLYLGGLVVTQGRKTFVRARRRRARVIPGPHIPQAGSYVLYLRSFGDDQRRKSVHEIPGSGFAGVSIGLLISGRSVEEQIADTLRPVGPLIAVGAPGEQLPHTGAARMYLPDGPDGAWQEPVRRLLSRSRLTVLTLGTSEGTMWELTESLRRLPPQRLVLLLPPMGDADYEHIRASTTARLPARPGWLTSDDLEPVQGVVHFAADWTPTATPVLKTHGNPLVNVFSALLPALTPAFHALDEHEQRSGRHHGLLRSPGDASGQDTS